MIRRDGRHGGPAPRPEPARAWSQAPEPQAYSQSRGSGHAPTQTPRPYAEPRRIPPAPRNPQPPAPPRPPAAPAEPPKQRRPRKRGTWLRRVALALVVLLVASVGGVVFLDTKLNRVDALADYPGRVADTPGTNWLLVGSDSRAGLSAEEDRQLAAGGDIEGKRTDTIMLVHIPKSGATTMVSIPRDSYVNIPGMGRGKINAAFSQDDGEQVLVQTVEEATGLHIDHYAEIGFGGFSGIVDALGGVDMCVPYPIDDPLAGINLQEGCQELTGPEALGFVRSRATAMADLDRMNNQRAFMSALLKKATSPWTLVNPLRLWPMMTKTANSLQVAEGDHLWNLAGLAWALRGKMVTTTVPVGGFDVVDGWGDVLLWDREKASEFFEALANDRQVPPSLLTGAP
ncbi:LytR family transcriptional regulator [Rhodococcus hoagii]|uniref:LCP family protein n=1 Tax=Rhodococcus hoagii TaxID=43767 RepID=UPI0009BC9C41|nr:LCP family protein [Prescottella equi]MBM4726167.1 LytR family transcriptional regulator [Prescottella equi]NKR41833.1 LytR family transcriptional regulator [Prescottella equi]NKR74818.1 LytR family transcriptional regulator [Prescottella equi]NKS18560.1 LytR family transcriptional regulator [Prescottella equi]NKS67421.1 LytR family transcriptional regulator [Prescottella equi]